MSNSSNVLFDTDIRLFYLSDEIDNTSMGKICFNLLRLIQIDDANEAQIKDYERKPIKIYVSSVGGSVVDMMGLISIINNSKTPIHTYCISYAMSAGFTIFICGHKRFASKNAVLLYHQISAGTRGSYQFMCECLKEDKRVQTDLEKITLSHTKITKERLDEVREKKLDWYIHSEDFIKLGLVDEFI